MGDTHVKYVFVVGEGDDELYDELSSAGRHGTASHPVGVLPADTVVLLVETDDLGSLLSFASSVNENAIEIL